LNDSFERRSPDLFNLQEIIGSALEEEETHKNAFLYGIFILYKKTI